MSKTQKGSFFALAMFLAATPLLADDLGRSEVFLCTSVQATQCVVEGGCETGPPWNWNIPQFIEVNLRGGVLKTTKASGENRSTPIRNSEDKGGSYFLQGVERGRAFSMVISKNTGMASIAVAAEGRAVLIFGACTPMPSNK